MTREEAIITLKDSLCGLCYYMGSCDNIDCDNREAFKMLEHKKIGYCKDCKWWKDSDGTFKRGIGAESRCPINREEVYEGIGYCFMFEPQKSEE